MKLTLTTVALLLLGFAAHAQRVCGNTFQPEEEKGSNLSRYQRFLQLEEKIQRFKEAQQLQTNSLISDNGIIIIPVVVHVLHNGGAIGTGLNISDAQVQSQINVLNEDFRRLNADRTNTPGVFTGVAADINIEFRLACTDPSGNSTNGITRTQTSVVAFTVDDKIKANSTGGRDPWPTSRYLNIWVGPLGGGLLGYSSWPFDFGTSPNKDGVVVRTTAFGNTGNVAFPFHLGRTATHEVGHWLSLFHIWADDDGACSGSDQCGDTPNQADENVGCPFVRPISCDNGPNGDMFMNYMDYTDDGCMNLFTADQRTRMRAMFLAGGPRAGFINQYFRIINPGAISCAQTVRLDNPTCITPTWTVVSGPATIASGQGTNQITLQPTGTGTVSLRATAANYQSDLNVSVTNTVPGTPTDIAGLWPPLGVSPNEILELDAGEPGMAGYSWWVEGGNILGSSSAQHVTIQVNPCLPNLPNMYLNVHLAYVNNCGQGNGYGEWTTVECMMGGAMMISPNPARSVVTVDVGSKESPIKEILVLDKTGNIKRKQAFGNYKGKVSIDVSALPNDVYYLRVFDGKKWKTVLLSVRR